MKQPNFKRKEWKIGTLADAQATAFSALALVARIRAAVGDPEGRLMQDDLIDHCRKLSEYTNRVKDEGSAHELWALAQLMPGEGIENGVSRVRAFLSASPNNSYQPTPGENQ